MMASIHRKQNNYNILGRSGGEKGIRTLDTVARIHAFQACAFDHSATSPRPGYPPSCRLDPRTPAHLVDPNRNAKRCERGFWPFPRHCRSTAARLRFAMIRFVFRLLATISLALAVILAVLDATRSVAMSRLVLTPLGESWKTLSPATLDSLRAMVEGRWPLLWDIVAVWLLSAPGAIVFAVLALLLYAIGHRPQRHSDFAAE